MRSGIYERTTNETIVRVAIQLDGSGKHDIATGMPMLDHLLAQLGFHSGCDLEISARSLDAIEHHLIEDTALALGEAIDRALGDRRGITRYGSALIPMDDALARAAIDIGGRPFSCVDLDVQERRLEGLDVVMIPHFFRSLTTKSGITLHLDLLAGTDPHHAIEACFKAFARALAIAWSPIADATFVSSTKGVI
jgi:imidazoleglycerol-phosphate dehydratase